MIRRASRVFACALFFACSDQPSNPDASVTGADAGTIAADASIADAGDGRLTCTPMVGEAEACGGEIEGVWRYVDLCGLPNALSDFLEGCPAARIVENQHVVTGSVSWNANNTYAWSFSDDFGIALEVPVSCTTTAGSCEGFGLLVSIAAGEEVTCMQRDQVCDCFSIGTREDVQNGIYDTIEGTITTTRSPDNRHRDYYYCVRGDRALLRRTDEGIVLLIER